MTLIISILKIKSIFFMIKNVLKLCVVIVLFLFSFVQETKSFSLYDTNNAIKLDTNKINFDTLEIGRTYILGTKIKKQYIGEVINKDSVSILILTKDGEINLLKSDIQIYKTLNEDNTLYDRIFSEKKDLSDSYLSRISAGMGIALYSHYGEGFNSFLFTFDANIYLGTEYKYFFINGGINSYSDSYTNKKPTSVYIIPTFGMNFFKGKLTVFAGAGAYIWGLFNDLSDGAPPVGYTLSFKTEYNIHENFSFGYQIQKPIFTGESSLDGLYLNNLYFSLKL